MWTIIKINFCGRTYICNLGHCCLTLHCYLNSNVSDNQISQKSNIFGMENVPGIQSDDSVSLCVREAWSPVVLAWHQ